MSPLKVVKLLDQGTDNPIVIRVSLQFFRILSSNVLELTQQEKDDISAYIFECMKDLLKAEESKNKYMTLEDETIQILRTNGGVKLQPLGISYDDPTEYLKQQFENFLVCCVRAIRKIVKIGGNIFHEEIKMKGPVELKKHLCKLIDPKSSEMEMITEDSIWMQELYDLRGSAEHDILDIGRFEVDVVDKMTLSIKTPILPNKKATIRNYICATLENCVGFCEDMIALLLNYRCPSYSQIVIISDDRLQKLLPQYKYTLDLKGKAKESLLRAMQKDSKKQTSHQT